MYYTMYDISSIRVSANQDYRWEERLFFRESTQLYRSLFVFLSLGFQWVKIRCDCSFCWYGRNCWQSLFKVSFRDYFFFQGFLLFAGMLIYVLILKTFLYQINKTIIHSKNNYPLIFIGYWLKVYHQEISFLSLTILLYQYS